MIRKLRRFAAAFLQLSPSVLDSLDMGNEKSSDVRVSAAGSDAEDTVRIRETINEPGHVQEMERHFGLLSMCCLGISFGNVCSVLGDVLVSISKEYICPIATIKEVEALGNGGPVGEICQSLFTV